MLKRTRVKAFGKGVEIKMEKGKIVEIMGPVVDVEFENGKLPMIKDALTVQLDGKTKVMEVAQQLGNNTVRAIMLASSDGLEKDMEVRQSDGTFEDKVFAMYPLIGSRILKPETVDKLNENARKYIDLVLREPWTKLSLRAEMQITLALPP